MSYLWDYLNTIPPYDNVVHIGFIDQFEEPLQPSPFVTEDGTSFEDYEIVPLYGDGDFEIVSGSALRLVDPDTAAALIVPWRLEDVEVWAHLQDDATNDHRPEIYLRWVDQDNYLVAQFTKPSGEPWRIDVGAVTDGALSASFATWDTALTTLSGAVVHVGIYGGLIHAAIGDSGSVVPCELLSGDPRTNTHHGATKAGIGARLWSGRFNYLFMRVHGLKPKEETGHLFAVTHSLMDEPPTLTGGGDELAVKAGLGLAQLLATTDHLRLRRRPASVGGNPALAAPLQGVLQPIAGSIEGAYGHVDGDGQDSRFNYPISLRMGTDPDTVYVADYGNAAIRKIELDDSGMVTTAVSTVAVLTDMPVYGGTGEPADDKPVHISYDPISNRMLVSGDWGLTDIQRVGAIDQYVEVLLRAYGDSITPVAGKWGSVLLNPEGTTAVGKYPLGDFISGWQTIFLETLSPEHPRGTFYEAPGEPNPRYCDPPENTVEVVKLRWRDGAYPADGGITHVPNYAYTPPLYTTLVTHSYVYPSYNGLGLVDISYGFGSSARPKNVCPPDPMPSGFEYEPAGFGFLRTGDEDTGFYERELVPGPDNVLQSGLPTAVGPLFNFEIGFIQKITIDCNSTPNSWVQGVDYSHSRGINYVPTRSIVYSHRRGIYYVTLGQSENTSTEILGWLPNQIVALDLYAPDHVTGTLELPTVSAYVERAPDPVEGTFTPADSDTVTLTGTIEEGTIGHIPIGIRSVTGGAVGLIDENGNIIVDEDGNIITF